MKYLLILLLMFSQISYAETVYGGANCIPKRDASGEIKRSSWQVVKFRRDNPCPSTGMTKGRCPGYVVDHIHPLCDCGLDKPENMQWQTKADSLAKDAWERSICR